MIVGDKSQFAIESSISRAYESPGTMAIGFFLIHIGGMSYGVRDPEATALAVSFDQVKERLQNRGDHRTFLSREADTTRIVTSVHRALYSEDSDDTRFFGLGAAEFRAEVYNSKIIWAPDGDEAFDDRSHVLQLDVFDRVRLIGFRIKNDSEYEALSHLWIEAAQYYEVLQQWQNAFATEWRALPKQSI